MSKPSFIVVTSAVTALVLFGGIIKVLTPLLPPQPANELQYEKADYLLAGSLQRLQWKTLDDDVFAEARRTDRPILMVMGTAWSAEARKADQQIFVDTDVQSFLAHNFIPVRVDLDQMPQWISAFIPISRFDNGLAATFQVVALDPQARFLDFYGNGRPRTIDPSDFLTFLFDARRKLQDSSSDPDNPIAGLPQLADRQMLMSPSTASAPEFGIHLQDLSEEVSKQFGGFPDGNTQVPKPFALRVCLLAGDNALFRRAAEHYTKSGMIDWIDGGFFRRSSARSWELIEFDKLAVHNAELMQTFALAGQMLNDPFYTLLAKNAFNSLAGEFVRLGYIQTARIGDELPTGRSRHSSFAVKDLRLFAGTNMLSTSNTLFARDSLGLRVEGNPRLTVRVADPGIPFREADRFNAVIEKLRETKKDMLPSFTSGLQASVQGHTAARMIWCARLWGDKKRLAIATSLFDNMEEFRAVDDIKRSPGGDGSAPYLGDYLAYADAALQDYLATGRVVSLERGLAVLRRAKFLFETKEDDGVWMTSLRPDNPNWPPDVQLPELADYTMESCTAQQIRICYQYGRLLRDAEPNPSANATVASSISQAAVSAVTHFAGLARSIGSNGSGFFCASFSVIDDAHVIVVGKNAQELADKIMRMLPNRLVAPAYADVRPDLQKRGDGIYILRGADIQGPLTLEQARKGFLGK